MPIYEYRPISDGCSYCKIGFDALQKMSEPPLKVCPKCGAAVQRIFSSFAACSIEATDESTALDSKLYDYEQKGMWSHAAELADKSALHERAMDNYRKAGYNF